jgi:retron-type reverse transcriptase
VDGQSAFYVETVRGREAFLAELRADLRTGMFSPVPVRERMIPKTGGKLRRLGIPTVRDRVVQAALKLVLEPIFEVDFKPCSYGFRPRRRAQDAIAEIHFLASAPRNYEWVLEADIEACFDCIDHTALMGRVRRRIGDRRVLSLVKAFCKGSSPRPKSCRTPAPGPRKAASSHRCWPTSRSPRSTSTSPTRGRRWATPAHSTGVVAEARPLTVSSATRTTSW